MMVLLCLLFGNNHSEFDGTKIYLSTFYVPAMSALAVIGACFTNIAISVSISRDRGILKRYRGTPLPTGVFVSAKLIHAVLLGVLLVICVVSAGVWLFDAAIVGIRIGMFLLVLALGSATFCALALAIAAMIPNGESSPAIVQAMILPLMFISDVFIPMNNAPAWLQWFASVFPVRHFALGLQSSYHPMMSSSMQEWVHLGVLAAWLVLGLFVALRFFRWEPNR